MKVTDLKIPIGAKLKLYIQIYEDGSGMSMGPSVEGKQEFLTDVIWDGPIYSDLMGQVKLAKDGRYVGIPVSAKDIIVANPQYKK